MSLAQRFERRLEGLVGGAFARVFKGQVEPVEIGSALQREAADKRNVMGNGRVLSPNRYRITLAPSDHERLAPWEVQLTNSLAELVQEYLDESGWSTVGDIEVFLARDEELRTGVFGVASRMEAEAPPRRRPQDSLSLPIIPGADPGDYAHQQQHREQYAPPPVHAPAMQAPAVPMAPVPAMSPPAAMGAPPMPPPEFGPGAPADPDEQYRNGDVVPGFAPPHDQQQRRAAVAMLIVDQSNRRYDLRPGSNVIGRGSEANLQLLDQGISRRHVDISYDGAVATAYDMGSTNGTTVNGHEITSEQLRHGDVIRVGHTRIVFHQERV